MILDAGPDFADQILFTSGMAFLEDVENNAAVLSFFERRKAADVMNMIRFLDANGVPSVMVSGIVMMIDRVTAPFGPAMVVTRD